MGQTFFVHSVACIWRKIAGRTVDGEHLITEWSLQHHLRGVEVHSRGRLRIVQRIADDGETDVCQMDANLVGATSFEGECDLRVSSAAPDDVVVRYCG